MFSLHLHRHNRHLTSFPTRRSSDLSKTDTGRPVFGGGGITPDEAVKPQLVPNSVVRLRDPIFFFAREVTSEFGTSCGLTDRKSTRLNSSHEWISYAVFCLKKKN